MKKKLTQVIMFLGFTLVVIGSIVDAFSFDEYMETVSALSALALVATVLAVAFVCAKNNVLKNVGYGLAALYGASGIPLMMTGYYMVTSIGLIFMFVSAVLYGLFLIIDFFGFSKDGKTACAKSDVVATLFSYKALQDEKLLTTEEFEELKNKVLCGADRKIACIDDLKKWKKLVDQNVITEEEFASMKSELISK